MIWVPIFCVFLFRGINFSLSEIVSSGGGFEYLLNSLKWFSIFLNDLVSFEYYLVLYLIIGLKMVSQWRKKSSIEILISLKMLLIFFYFILFIYFFLFFFFFFSFFFVIIFGLIFNIFNILQIFKGFLEIKQPIIHINIFLLNIY